MPYVEFPFRTSVEKSVYVHYEEGDDTKDVYRLLFDEDMHTFGPLIEQHVLDELTSLLPDYMVYDCELVDSGIEWNTKVPDDDVAHDWHGFVNESAYADYMMRKRLGDLTEELHEVICTGDYKKVATIAAQLAELAE